MTATRLALCSLEDRTVPAATGFGTGVTGPIPVTAGLIGPGLPGFNAPPSNLFVGGVPDGTGTLFVPTTNLNGYATPGTVQQLIPGFAGSVRTALGDVNGDGTPDLIGGAGPGGQRVIVYDGVTNATLADFLPFEESFAGGVYVSAGNINQDGRAEVVVTPDRTGGPRVSVFNGADLAVGNTVRVADFLGLADRAGVIDTAFRGGARTAIADVNGNGFLDVIVAAGFGGGPRVTIWDGGNLPSLGVAPTAVPTTTGIAATPGVTAGLGGTPVSGSATIPIAGTSLLPAAGATGSPLVGTTTIPIAGATTLPAAGTAGVPIAGTTNVPLVGTTTLPAAGTAGAPLAGTTILPAAGTGTPTTTALISPALPIANFFAFEDTLRNGVFVAGGDINGDGCADLIFGAGPGGGPRVRIVDGNSVALETLDFSLDDSDRSDFTVSSYFAGDSNARGGVRVATRDIDGDQFADVVTGSGLNQTSEVRVYLGTSILANPTQLNPDQRFDPFGGVLADGVFVG